MKKVICLGGGPSQLCVIYSALRLNLDLIVVDKKIYEESKKFSSLFINESTYEPENIFNELKNNNIENIIGILNRSSSIPVLTNAKLASLIGLQTYSINTGNLLISKVNMNNTLKSKDIKIPESVKLSNNIDFQKLNYPYVLKPDIKTTSDKGVYYIDCYKNLEKYKKLFPKFKIIKDEYIEGRDICFGAIISNKKLLPLVILEQFHEINGFGEIMIKGMCAIPYDFDKELFEKLIYESKKVLKNLEIDNSFFWISFRYNSQKELYFIELHLDIGGDFILDFLLPVATGNENIIDEFIKIYLYGEKHYNGMLNLNFTTIEYDKGKKISKDGRNLSINKHSSYNLASKVFK